METENRCNLARNCLKSEVIVKPEKGKAILWYSHVRRRDTHWLGQIDFRSEHGGCDVRKGQKWIANNWINVSPARSNDIENWAILEYNRRKEKQSKLDESDGGEMAETPPDSNDKLLKNEHNEQSSVVSKADHVEL